MRAFEYASPKTVEEVIRRLQEDPSAAVLAGGTDLLSLMKDDVERPSRLVNVKGVEALGGSELGDEGLRLGATLTLAELLAEESIARAYPALVQAAAGILSPQILNMGTVGGELCQRPRCWYYRAGFGLLAEQGGGSMVEAGDSRYHAILGNDGAARFVSASSLAPALIALGARVRILGGQGEREVALEELYRVPTAAGERELTLAHDEVVADVRVPRAADSRSATYEVRQRQALDWPLATASVALRMEGETVAAARVVLGHVAPVPWICEAAANRLLEQSITETSAEEAGAAAVEGARPLGRNGYKIKLARTAVKRALLDAAGVEV